jgi:hypothetical protein
MFVYRTNEKYLYRKFDEVWNRSKNSLFEECQLHLPDPERSHNRTPLKNASRLIRHTGDRLEITVWHAGERAEF